MPIESMLLDSVNCFLRKENNFRKEKDLQNYYEDTQSDSKYWYQQNTLPGFANWAFPRDQTKIKDTVPSASSH